MNDGLLDAFRHNAWATREVLRVCRGLRDAQLDRNVTGTYGSIIDTLRHLVKAEAGYYTRLTGDDPGWDRSADSAPGVAELAGYVDDLESRWLRFLETPFDAERMLPVRWNNGTSYDVPAAVVLVQALHHANEHRTQVCTTITAIGGTSPELGVWEFAEATGRARPPSS